MGTPYGLGFVDAQASLLVAQGKASRQLAFYGATSQGDTGSLGLGGQVKGGVRVDVSGWQVEPSLGFSALRLHQGGLNEYGAGAVGANIDRGELTSLQSQLGGRVDRGFAFGEGMRLVGSASAAWAHEFGDKRTRVSGRISGLPGAGFARMNAGGGRDALVAYMGFPAQHRANIHSNNPIVRFNGEIKRRSDVVGIFPNEAAMTRLIGALLLEQNDEWAVQHARYMTLQTIATLGDDRHVSLPPVAA